MSQELSNSSRRLEKATYAPIQLDQTTASTLAKPFEKAAALNAMSLQTGEVSAVQNAMGRAASTIPSSSWAAISRFESKPVGALMPRADAVAGLPSADLQAFAKALVNYRVANLNDALQATPPPPAPSAPPPGPGKPPPAPSQAPGPAGVLPPKAVLASAAATRMAVDAAPQAVPAVQPATPQTAVGNVAASARLAGLYSLVTAAKSSSQNFDQAVKVTPIGRLHLERIEMTPAGIERGELLATIPLSPLETTGVMQKEWTTTSDEFTSIVTDYLEQVSEKGVTEKSELAQSSDTQTKHDNQIDLSASVSGKYGFVSFAANSSMKLADSISDTEKVSRNHSVETTRKAATRSRKERKVTIQQVSTTGSEQVTTRTLTNPSSTNAMRIDYYSMMRKWRVRLYRYGLRMTYDIAIPEPGAALREPLVLLNVLNQQINKTFTFNLDPNAITPGSYQSLETQYDIALPAPPEDTRILTFSVALQDSSNEAVAQSIDMAVPDGYQIDELYIGGWGSPHNDGDQVSISFATSEEIQMQTPGIAHKQQALFAQNGTGATEVKVGSLQGATGSVSIQFLQGYASAGSIFANLYAKPTAATVAAWQQQCWQTIQQAQSNAFYLNQQALVSQRDALQAQIGNVDTLTLREEEMQEVMKGVIRWLMGPAFGFMPDEVVKDFQLGADPNALKSYAQAAGISLTSDELSLLSAMGGTGLSFTSNQLDANTNWTAMFQYGELVKFLQEAIEWENLLYFLYPYFWDVPTAWDLVRSLEHPDLTRQQFVRAGSARVVITVRPGFEDDFAAFIEQGQFGSVLQQDHPYMTIAQEIQAYNETNYPGIPPANPDAVPVNAQDAASTACSSSAAASASPVALTVDSTDGFQVGMTVTVDTYDSSVQEAETITAIPDANTIEVAQLKFAHDGSSTPFPIVQPGEAGVVIAEWYEYTPTHGTDIGLATPLPEMD